MSYSICLVGAIAILINDEEAHPYVDLAFNFVSKFGCASAFNAVYLGNNLFPVVFSSTTFGICALMGSTASFTSIFVIYDYVGKPPWYLFSALCVLGIFLCLLQRER